MLVVGAQALPQFLPYPSLYHVEDSHNCTSEQETITTQSCVPHTEQDCEDVEVPHQKIEFEDNCRVSHRIDHCLS